MGDQGVPVLPHAQLANPFLDAPPPPPAPLSFQEHNLPPLGGYQSSGAFGGSIGPHPTSGFAQPPSLSYRVPDAAPPPLQSSAFPAPPSSAPAPSAPSTGLSSYFSVRSYSQYFDVDTADVVHRIRLASLPFGSTFMTTVQDKPDLYGPFWIAATLVFIAAATGNLSSYLAYTQLLSTEPDATWSYDIKKVTLSAVLFYGYISVLPLLLYVTLRYWAAPSSLTALVTLYGYSLVVYVPIAILCVVPLDAVRWPIVLVGGAVACLCLVLNLRRLMDNFEDAKRKSIVLGLAGASQFGLAVAVKMYVFAY